MVHCTNRLGIVPMSGRNVLKGLFQTGAGSLHTSVHWNPVHMCALSVLRWGPKSESFEDFLAVRNETKSAAGCGSYGGAPSKVGLQFQG